jgi:hypothetical protein
VIDAIGITLSKVVVKEISAVVPIEEILESDPLKRARSLLFSPLDSHTQITGIYRPAPCPKVGLRPSSPTLGAGCGGRGCVVARFGARTDGVSASGEALLPWWNPNPDPSPHPRRRRVRWARGKGKAMIPIFVIVLDPCPNHLYHARIPSHQEGRLAIVTKRGAGCGGRESADNERY